MDFCEEFYDQYQGLDSVPARYQGSNYCEDCEGKLHSKDPVTDQEMGKARARPRPSGHASDEDDEPPAQRPGQKSACSIS
jgi:hypothetical protein